MGDNSQDFLVVDNPSPTDPGEYYLIVSKPGRGLYGGGEIVYSVDEVGKQDGTVYASIFSPAGIILVAQFPDRLDYLVVRKASARFVSPEDVAREQHGINLRMQRVIDGLPGTGTEPVTAAGMTAQAPVGQYL